MIVETKGAATSNKEEEKAPHQASHANGKKKNNTSDGMTRRYCSVRAVRGRLLVALGRDDKSVGVGDAGNEVNKGLGEEVALVTLDLGADGEAAEAGELAVPDKLLTLVGELVAPVLHLDASLGNGGGANDEIAKAMFARCVCV